MIFTIFVITLNEYREYRDQDFLVPVDGEVTAVRTDRIRHVLFEIELDTDQIINSIIRSRRDWNIFPSAIFCCSFA